MRKIALVQNQVYMSYASKSDVRPLLAKFGYHTDQIILYTSHNIMKLKHDLEDEIDGIIFSSNSLSEPFIKKEVESEEFKQPFLQFLDQGKGCLILHQKSLASDGIESDGGKYNFLPPIKNVVKAVKREQESAQSGDFKRSRLSQAHPIYNYPNAVSIDQLKEHCKLKKGLYWHYLDQVDSTEWDTLLYDENEQYAKRPLLIASREASKHRVVITSLNIDWQREEVLLNNLILFILEGKCHTAILSDSSFNSIGFDFFLTTLKSRNYRYRLYDLSNDIDEFKKQIEQGTHSIVVLGPCLPDKESVLKGVDEFLYGYTLEGKIKYIGIEPKAHNLKQFFVAGREKFALSILYETEIEIQRDLKQKGLIDGSFWSSVDALKVLNDLESTYSSYSLETIRSIFSHVAKHLVDDASYDGLLVPTVSLLWLRVTYLGLESEETRKTIHWIKQSLQRKEEIEVDCVLAYNTLLAMGIDTDHTKDQLSQIINGKDINRLNEIEIIHYLQAAILLNDIEQVKQYVISLKSKRNSEMLWIDISISSTIVNLLLDALLIMKNAAHNTKEIEEIIEELVFPTVITMQNSTKKIGSLTDIKYLWENKANTTLKCVHAMLKFEGLIDLPVTEIVQSLFSYTKTGNHFTSDNNALEIIEEYKEDHHAISQKNEELLVEMKETIKEQQRITNEKKTIEAENYELRTQLNTVKIQNKQYDDEMNKSQQRSILTNILIVASILLVLVIAWVTIFFVSNKEIFKELLQFYKLEGKDLISGSFLLIPLLWFLLNNFKKQKSNKTL